MILKVDPKTHSGPEQQQAQIKTGKKAPEGFLLEDKIDKKKLIKLIKYFNVLRGNLHNQGFYKQMKKKKALNSRKNI